MVSPRGQQPSADDSARCSQSLGARRLLGCLASTACASTSIPVRRGHAVAARPTLLRRGAPWLGPSGGGHCAACRMGPGVQHAGRAGSLWMATHPPPSQPSCDAWAAPGAPCCAMPVMHGHGADGRADGSPGPASSARMGPTAAASAARVSSVKRPPAGKLADPSRGPWPDWLGPRLQPPMVFIRTFL